MKNLLNKCYDEEGNYNPGLDLFAWIEASVIMAMGIIIFCLCR